MLQALNYNIYSKCISSCSSIAIIKRLPPINAYMKDYYKILDISLDADIQDVKKAYRTLAFRYHPDKNKSSDASQIFIAITEAYEVLSNPDKKREYDILYAKFIKRQSMADADPILNTKQKEWGSYGQSKAREYASMNYDDFSDRILKEIKIGLSIVPKLFLIILILVGISGFFYVLPEASGSNLVILLGIILGYCIVVYRLYKKMIKNYSQKRAMAFKRTN